MYKISKKINNDDKINFIKLLFYLIYLLIFFVRVN